MIKAFFLDFDGTLVESEMLWRQSPIRMLSAYNLVIPRFMLQEPVLGNFRHTLHTFLEQHAALAAQHHLSYEICEQWCVENMGRNYRQSIELKPHAEALLAELFSQNLPLFILSAAPASFVEATLQRCGIGGYIKRIYSTYGQQENKNCPELFARLAVENSLKPAECALLDDSLYALQGAKQAGFHTWAVEDKVQYADKPAIQRTAEQYFTHLDEVTAMLQALWQSAI